MFNTILLPIDGSKLSARAMPFAQQLAGTRQIAACSRASAPAVGRRP
jgi:hypothetical protein